MELTFEVTKDSQAIVRTDQNVPVAGSVGYLGATFKLQTVDQLTWTPLFRYLSKQYKPDNTTAESLDGTETIKCVVPHEVIHYNKFYVSIFGVDPSTKLVRVTFPWVEVETEEGCDDKGDSSSDPSLTVYEKVLRDIQDIQSKVVNPDNLSAAIAQYFVDNPIKTLTEKDVEPWIATYVTNNKSTLKGDTGATGPQGESGPQGPKGDTGLTGAAGPQGLKGDIGPKGDTGAVGPKGDIGLTGAIGPQGLKGDTGAAGQNGVDGATGPQGPKGDTGAIGPQGPKGDIGAKGADGTAGTAGTAGKDGADGYSPSAKVEQTSTGATITITDKTGITSATVKNGLKGDTGATGPAGQNGVDGAIGPQGLKGDTGLTGAAGPKGDTGLQGIQGPAGNGFLYKATLTVAAWTSTTVNSVAAYTQTVTPTKVNGGPTITAQMQFDGPMCRQTNNIDTNEKLLEVLNIINVGYTVTNAAGTVTVTVFEKPTSDIEVYWKGTVVTS